MYFTPQDSHFRKIENRIFLLKVITRHTISIWVIKVTFMISGDNDLIQRKYTQ